MTDKIDVPTLPLDQPPADDEKCVWCFDGNTDGSIITYAEGKWFEWFSWNECSEIIFEDLIDFKKHSYFELSKLNPVVKELPE